METRANSFRLFAINFSDAQFLALMSEMQSELRVCLTLDDRNVSLRRVGVSPPSMGSEHAPILWLTQIQCGARESPLFPYLHLVILIKIKRFEAINQFWVVNTNAGQRIDPSYRFCSRVAVRESTKCRKDLKLLP